MGAVDLKERKHMIAELDKCINHLDHKVETVKSKPSLTRLLNRLLNMKLKGAKVFIIDQKLIIEYNT